ncbi:Lft1p KNAG_0B03370 [Huiozyma naganishii CBS 8797]|uniref:Uncharacterized protein n=1 Tax=Huiozyma naganishii (strain ATCC MYA-139 / BCRC 22969 / CBS 8797 / KCTC 17520 / NBRC 10181 / NCYC 3082 / Yp74L-3) TaxID=1071383 RepID=J7S3K7_HUIN7|nr:hypothetical protein KNAG_0B03370 [Kazachstania naganishii CBS 8797]CCK68779.1 hypothetical protein KNAG_0B03370 [Kazachstania naganishii CBS 8797]
MEGELGANYKVTELLNSVFGPEFPGVPQDTKDEIPPNDASLYDMLNEVEGSRKLMNQLCNSKRYDPAEAQVYSVDKSTVLSKAVSISRNWYQDQHISNVPLSASPVLQMETPVVFSWSSNHPNGEQHSQDEKIFLPQDSKHDEEPDAIPTEREPTNKKLFRIVSEEMEKVPRSPRSWNYILRGVEDSENETKGTSTSSSSVTSPEKNPFQNSSFHVNPLEKFVARELPKQKKDPTESFPKHKSKRRSALWFFGGRSKGKHKSKHNHKEKHDKPEGGAKKIRESGDSTIPIDMHDTQIHDLVEETIHEEGDLEFDVDELTHHDSGVHQSKPDLESTPEPNNAVRNHPTSKTLEVNVERSQEDAGDPPAVAAAADDDDDEFGDFEQGNAFDIKPVVEERPMVTIPSKPPVVPELVDDSTSRGHTPPSHVSLDTFVPLQPKKKM